MAGAATLTVFATGQFSSTDTANSLVAPGGMFGIGFQLNGNTAPLPGTVTSLGFDVPIASFLYTLNNVQVNAAASEIRFNTLANGGLFDVTIGSGLSSSEFDFQGAQLFSGTTAAPAFAAGRYSLSSWTYSDPANYDLATPASQAVSAAVTPEPATVFLISAFLIPFIGWKFRKR